MNIDFIRFLESIENIRRVVTESTGREPNVETARQISSCLQQGRLFFESAQRSGPEIRPLLLSYGTISYARAVIVAKTGYGLERQPHTHGLKDVSSDNCKLQDLRIRIEGDGTFQRILNVARTLERSRITRQTQSVWFAASTCTPAELNGKEVTLRDILARIVALEDSYRETFRLEPAVVRVTTMESLNHNDILHWQISAPTTIPPSADNIVGLVNNLAMRFPVFRHLSFLEAWFAWDRITIALDNSGLAGWYPQLSKDVRQTTNEPPHFERFPLGRAMDAPIPLPSILSCASGSLGDDDYPIFTTPLFGANVPNIALLYLGSYLLGSLVRYRPQVWVHAMYGHATSERPRDDSTISIVEQFLDLIEPHVSRWADAAIRATPL